MQRALLPDKAYALVLRVHLGLDAEGQGDGSYDWHFRHAMILSNGDFVIKPDIVIAGDGIIHRWGGL